MTVSAFSRTALLGLGLSAIAIAAPASAQGSYPVAPPMNPSEVQSLPVEYRTGPAVYSDTETVVGPDGVETITRTRRIESSAPIHSGTSTDYEYDYEYAPGYGQGYAPAYGYAPAATVFERDQWLEECERRTSGHGNREKGGIIGALLGAIAGGVAGNQIAGVGDRLGGTLIGAGVGGLGGLLLGQLIGGGRDRSGQYDCEAALDGYLSQYGQPGSYAPPYRVATRTIPAPAYAPPVQYGYGYAPAYGYSYSYAPPQQIVYVPVRYQQQQRVIVRETVREEVIPGAVRSIPTPAPVPRPIKGEPIYTKTQPIPVKGY